MNFGILRFLKVFLLAEKCRGLLVAIFEGDRTQERPIVIGSGTSQKTIVLPEPLITNSFLVSTVKKNGTTNTVTSP